MIDKNYNPQDVEGRIYDEWVQQDTFAAGAGAKEGAESYCIPMPPPNVTGDLHVGHALTFTIQDMITRFERMRGKNVLWQPGTDHAGIATQMIVERKMMEQQLPSRREMGREKFLEKVWEWKEQSGGTIVSQLRRLGASADWSRERFTMDDGLSKAVIKVFTELYKQGLIYKDKRLVNWHPVLQTAISDLEVENIEINGHMWHLRYPIEGTDETIVVATTRPETMLGDTGVAVHPEDERYKHLVGKMVILPLTGRKIPIVTDEHADPEQGSGAVKITPAHDFNDFEVGKRNNLEQINIFTDDAKINDEAPEAYRGMDRFEARKKIIADLDALGALVEVEDKVISVPHDEKSKMVVIEPYLTDQWYVDAETLAKPALAAVKEGRTKFVPKNWENTYYRWMENIQPWCISRQLWWGHQIPAWYGPDGEYFVAEDEAEAQALADAHYGAPTPITRDEDVLDTWFSSALWPFSTLGWPDKTPELETYYKTSTLVTGFDIIFFWVARMMMFGIHFMDEEPFENVYVHALVRDEHGQKMSKTKGNVIDPLTLFDEYGADATRFTLAAMAAQGRDLKLAISRVEGYRNFVTKIWNAARFLEMNECKRVEGYDPASVNSTLNKWILSRAAKTVAEVERTLEAFRFNEAANAAYDFVWGTFCDWFVELAKPVFNGDDEELKAETRATAAYTLDQILKLLHPFMPFVTEELWAQTGKNGPAREALLIVSDWPELSNLVDEAAESEMGWMIDLITGIRSLRVEMNVPAGAKVPLVVIDANDESKARLGIQDPMIKRLARVESIDFADEVPGESAQLVLGEATFAMPLAGVIDIAAEKDRLNKELTKLDKEIDGVAKKLANEQFISKAPAHVIDDQKQRKTDAEEKKERVEAALARLG
ncbi:valine--tRNA ligase [Maritalea mediterranea]|uniref:Valine--tRNA ligase n=1 Tax=Maritalea mediterranea TaxID=2909667 RepID=A0ABS9E5W8_9HYPH|nr:valine--tRNA ligase [Maritalea mediterranea]MCF4098270.1 valine--tRNA ligase [Maritalea mediterranea]